MAATIRRLYLYLVAFISLYLVVGSTLNLIRILLDRLVAGYAGTDWRLEASFYIALLLVSGVIYAIHWFLCWRFARGPLIGEEERSKDIAREPDDRASIVRPVYLYSVLAVAMFVILFNGYDLLYRVLDHGTLADLPTYLSLLANLAVAGVLWGLHCFVIRRDAPAASPHAATVRRLYTYGLSAIGLAVLILGLVDLLHWCVDQLLVIAQLRSVSSSFYASPAEDVARIVVGGAVWLGHMLWCQIRVHIDRDEQHSVLRHAYLYLVAFATATTALMALVVILKGGLDLILGSGGTGNIGDVLADLNAPASMVIVCGAFWLLHRILRWRDTRRMALAPFQTHLRRLHGYLMAGVGLMLVVSGGANLLHAILRMAGTALAAGTLTVTVGSALREEVSLYTALLIVGVPVWLFHWIRMQREVQPVDQEVLWRRAYLYLVFLASALAFLFNITWILFTLLTIVLGLTPPGQWGDICEPVANLVIYGVLWGYHLFVLAGDVRTARRYRAALPTTAPLTATIAVVDDGDGSLGTYILNQLLQERTGATLVPAGLNLTAAETMAAALGEVPAAIDEVIAQVQQADVLVGPVRAFLARSAADAVPFPDLVATLVASPARRVVLPLGDECHALVGLADRSPEALARQAVRWALQVARGEEPQGGEGISTGAVVGVTVLATLLLSYLIPALLIILVNIAVFPD